MNNELIIDTNASGTTIALLENKNLIELDQETNNLQFVVGDVYLGRVKKVVPGLNAAFVDLGSDKDAFLHYLDLGPQVKSFLKLTRLLSSGNAKVDKRLENFSLEEDIDKTGKISQILSSNLWIPVQIVKEPIANKGPRISSEISIAGRYLIFVPFSNGVAISQKIKDPEERKRLKRIVAGIKPQKFSLIIRTAAENATLEELETDMADLLSKWDRLVDKLRHAKPPQQLLGELNRTSTILRDLLNDDFQQITVNDAQVYNEIREYLKNIAPDKENLLKLYKGKLPIFEQYGIDKQIKTLFGKTVTFSGGCYLIIERTEAMHVIDVNSGVRNKSQDNQEANALQVNLEAAKEVARQLRLRDLGGIIVVDFIDLQNAAHRKQLVDVLRDEMKRDRAKHTILPPSKFGIIEITRQRVRPENSIATLEKCPVCLGTGEVKPSILLVDEINSQLDYLISEQNEKNLVLGVSPYVYAFLKHGYPSQRFKWFLKYKQWVRLRSLPSYHMMQYSFFNSLGEEIEL